MIQVLLQNNYHSINMKGLKTIWTPEMIEKLTNEFPYRFSRDVGKDLGLSIRTIIRKARELGLEKEEGFLAKNRAEISKLAIEAKPPNPMKGVKGWSVPGGEKFQFKPGEKRYLINYKKVHEKRNETIRKERLRIKYGLPRKTKLKLTI